MEKVLLILAAGMGTRYGGLKQIEKVGPNGETILEYSIFDALNAGFNKVIFVIRHRMKNSFQHAVIDRISNFISCDTVFQESDDLPNGIQVKELREKPWGTGHAVWAARHVIKTPFAVINADDFYGRAAYHQINQFTKKGMSHQFCLIAYPLGRTLSKSGSVSRGICQCNDENLESITEYTKVTYTDDGELKDLTTSKILENNCLTSMNCWGLQPEIFSFIEKDFGEFLSKHSHNKKEEYYLPELIHRWTKKEEENVVKVLPTKGHWMGITYLEDRIIMKNELVNRVRSKEYPSPLFKNPIS